MKNQIIKSIAIIVLVIIMIVPNAKAITTPSLKAAFQEASEKATATSEKQKASTAEAKAVTASASTEAPIVVAGSAKACFKKKGTTDKEAIVMVLVMDGKDAGKFQMLQDPFDVTDKGLMSLLQAYSIKGIAESIQKHGKPLGLNYGKNKEDGDAVLVLSFAAADPVANSLTLTPGPTMEYFDCTNKNSEAHK